MKALVALKLLSWASLYFSVSDKFYEEAIKLNSRAIADMASDFGSVGGLLAIISLEMSGY